MSGGALSCPGSEDGVSRYGSEKHPCVTDTLIILPRTCHGRGVFVHSSTGALYPARASHLLSSPTPFHGPHSKIAEVCLTYLNFGCIKDLPSALYPTPPTMPLLEYPYFYWGKHAGMEMTGNIKILAVRLPDRFDEHISVRLLLLRYNRD